MKIYFVKNGNEIVGAQIIDSRGKEHELTSNDMKCGLWLDGRQVIGTMDFDLCCCSSTARKRLIDQAIFRCSDPWLRDVCESLKISRKPLF